MRPLRGTQRARCPLPPLLFMFKAKPSLLGFLSWRRRRRSAGAVLHQRRLDATLICAREVLDLGARKVELEGRHSTVCSASSARECSANRPPRVHAPHAASRRHRLHLVNVDLQEHNAWVLLQRTRRTSAPQRTRRKAPARCTCLL